MRFKTFYLKETEKQFPKYGIYTGYKILTSAGIDLDTIHGIKGTVGVKIDKVNKNFIVTYSDITVPDFRDNRPYQYPPNEKYNGIEIKLKDNK